jgi:glycosyltransferase involved in cell wall biosynthesis
MSKFDFLIPVYNEGDNIIPVLHSLEQGVKTPFRVLICYDFDEDNTLPALRRYQAESQNPLEIVLVKNQGKGAHGAVLTGFRYSTAPAVLVFPADDDYNAPRLDAMFDKFKQGYDIVAASRFIPGGCMVGCPWLKAFLVRLSAFTLYFLGRIPTHDSSNGFRLFSRRVLDEIKIESTQGFTYSIELLVKTHRLGWRIGEVPVAWYERTKGQSRFKVLKWLRAYLRWYFYAFATTYLRRPANTVPRQKV